MPHHGNEEEHGSSENRSQANEQENEPQKPVIHDNRKVDEGSLNNGRTHAVDTTVVRGLSKIPRKVRK